MDINKELEKIFNSDELGLLNVKPKTSNACTSEERLVRSFEEINDFVDKNGKIPEENFNDSIERCLSYRLDEFLKDMGKMKVLKQYDRHNLLDIEYKVPETLDDIFADDEFGLLSDDVDIFTLKNIPKEIAKTDFVARRKSCPNFEEYEEIFKKCQNELKYGIRTLEKFNEKQIEEGQMFVLNGILVYVEKLYNIKRVERGYENKIDGRTHLVFENGTESNMRFRSLCKRLFETGKHVVNNIDIEMKKISHLQAEDKPTGYIYILQSRSKDERIKSIRHLYKIGYCETTVAERIKNAIWEPTYLMAPVKVVAEFKTYNMNTQKFEDLLHRFLGQCQISIEVFDNNGSKHTPREWFQVPYEIIEQAVKLIVTGEVINYIYDRNTMTIRYIGI
jgi:hypothetical protein